MALKDSMLSEIRQRRRLWILLYQEYEIQKKLNYNDRGQVHVSQEERKREVFQCEGNQGDF